MKFITKRLFTLIFFLAVLEQVHASGQQSSKLQREIDFNFNWKFSLVENNGLPSNVPLDDSKWRDVRLPHDWSVEGSFDESLEGATGYLPGGVGVYQKHFNSPENLADKSTFVLFDGVYNNATFWLNGKLLGENPYGYSPVYFDLSKYLKTDGGNNVLTVHVDHSRYVDSRWYTGSGIYRNVKLITVDKVHIPIWGTFMNTPEVSNKQAKLNLAVKVNNSYNKKNTIKVSTDIIDRHGNVVAQQTKKVRLKRKSENEFAQDFIISNPLLWDTQNPNMYKAITTLIKDEEVIDQYTTPFGIRSIKFEAKKGFFLNGKSTLMKGVSLHHDGGLVGAAVPKGVWKRRLTLLKEAGVNAIRNANNPYSKDFLFFCD
jgi:beta-galactosidase/beta-glucuronidase